MAIYSNLPVFQDTYQLLLQFVQLSRNMQRDYRYTLGEQVKRAILDTMLAIFRANKTTDKIGDIQQGREKIVETQIVIRVLHETRQISTKQFALMIECTEKVSKQLANWETSCRPTARQT